MEANMKESGMKIKGTTNYIASVAFTITRRDGKGTMTWADGQRYGTFIVLSFVVAFYFFTTSHAICLIKYHRGTVGQQQKRR